MDKKLLYHCKSRMRNNQKFNSFFFAFVPLHQCHHLDFCITTLVPGLALYCLFIYFFFCFTALVSGLGRTQINIYRFIVCNTCISHCKRNLRNRPQNKQRPIYTSVQVLCNTTKATVLFWAINPLNKCIMQSVKYSNLT